MTPVEKALWYIESRFRDPFALSDVARASGVTKHYLIRAFGSSIGMPVMQYVKARRLSEAAKALTAGAPDILSVAMLTGYQSHEAFSRAIRDRFGISPSEIRDLGTTKDLVLLDPVMLHDHNIHLTTLDVGHRRRLSITGLSRRFDTRSRATIPSLWRDFDQHVDRTGSQLGRQAYGVCSNYGDDGDFDYLCGIEGLPATHTTSLASQLVIPAGTYASFRHEGHISGIRNTWSAIYNNWLPNSGFKLTDMPEFELYSEDFDPVEETGSVSIYIPVATA